MIIAATFVKPRSRVLLRSNSGKEFLFHFSLAIRPMKNCHIIYNSFRESAHVDKPCWLPSEVSMSEFCFSILLWKSLCLTYFLIPNHRWFQKIKHNAFLRKLEIVFRRNYTPATPIRCKKKQYSHSTFLILFFLWAYQQLVVLTTV